MTFLVISGIAISLFVFFHLLRQEGVKTLAGKIALSIQLLWIVRFVLFYLKLDPQEIDNPFSVVYDQTLFFLDGLLVWLYVKALLKPGSFSWRTWLHFIPFLLIFSYATFMAVEYPENAIAEYIATTQKFEGDEPIFLTPVLVYVLFVLGINIYYLYRGVQISRIYNTTLKENLSTIDNLTVNWVQRFQRLWMLLFLLPIVFYFINYMLSVVDRQVFGAFILICLLLLSVVFNLYLLDQVYKPVSVFGQGDTLNRDTDTGEQNTLLEKLESQMSREKYYRDEALSLAQLAGYLELKPADLTALIKCSEYENFYDLINSYRVIEMKKQLLESEDQIIQLAYQTGFRSKSTFNKIFKQKTGMTPKEYRGAHK